jgi:hypothetical protein
MRFFSRPRFRTRPRYRGVDLPDGKPTTTPDPVPPPQPERRDWPEIASRHPAWWQVHRIELHAGARRLALIAETRTEDEAFRVAALQVSKVRITKWGSKERPYESFAEPLVIVTGEVQVKG